MHTCTRTHYEITLCITQLICSSRLQKPYYVLIGQWADGEAMERLWSWNVHCLDLQRWRETITFVWTVSIATFSLSLPVFLSIPSYLFIYWKLKSCRKSVSLPSFNKRRHLLCLDDAWREAEGAQLICSFETVVEGVEAHVCALDPNQ